MNIRSKLVAAGILASFFAASAQAAIVDYSGISVNMSPRGLADPIVAGQSGDITSSYVPGINASSGYLAANTTVQFSYDLSSFTTYPPVLLDTADFGYSSGGEHYSGSAAASSNGAAVETHSVRGSGTPSTALVIADANIDSATNKGTLTIENKSSGLAYFSVILSAFLGNAYTYTYNAVSNVPLPASMQLFAMGLVGLAGFGWMRKKAMNEMI